mgnify:CR=1 FL=1
MTKGLRSRLAQYGDEEFALFLRRGFLKGAGFTDDALDRPIVGILSTASDFNPCHKTAPQVAEAISRGVRMAGALPFVFPTVSLHEAFSYPTSMLLRNLMAMDVEEMIKALPLDAVVLIGGCDKTIPAELMGAISANMPAIVVNVGSMLAGKHEGARLGALGDDGDRAGQRRHLRDLDALRVLQSVDGRAQGLHDAADVGSQAEDDADGAGGPLPTMMLIAGSIELVAGALIAIGLFTRPAAFLASGLMAFAYFIAHAPQNFFPVNNGGDAAILYCFVFLYLVFAGPGEWSLDALRKAHEGFFPKLMGGEVSLEG